MTTVKVMGTIVPNNLGMVYDYLGLDYTSPNLIADSLTGQDIDLVINSGGGDVFAGSEIYSMLKDYSGNVNVKIYGLAASSASIIAMSGDKVSIGPTAQIMIHNVSSETGGDYHDMDKMSDVLQKANDALANAYVSKTGKSKDEILELMDKETWLNADDSVNEGFADEILFSSESSPILTNSLNPIISSETSNKILNLISQEKEKKANKKEETKKIQMEIEVLKMRGKSHE